MRAKADADGTPERPLPRRGVERGRDQRRTDPMPDHRPVRRAPRGPGVARLGAPRRSRASWTGRGARSQRSRASKACSTASAAAEAFELPADRIGDLVVLADGRHRARQVPRGPRPERAARLVALPRRPARADRPDDLLPAAHARRPRRALKKSFGEGGNRRLELPDSGARLVGATENHTRMGEAGSGLRPSRVDRDAPGPLYPVWVARRWPIGLRLTSAAAQLACSRPLALPRYRFLRAP